MSFVKEFNVFSSPNAHAPFPVDFWTVTVANSRCISPGAVRKHEAMFLSRVAWQRCGPLARQFFTRRVNLYRDVVPQRLMSSVPGSSGTNWAYAILCGGAFSGAVAYAYSTVTSDSARYADRISKLQAQSKNQWQPKPWPLKGGAEEVVEAAAQAVGEEAEIVELAVEVNEREAASSESVVETVAEAVAERAEVVANVATVVEEAAEEVATVAQQVKEMAVKVETVAEAFEAPKLLAEETTAVEQPAPADLEELRGKSNVLQENTELSAPSMLEEPLMVCVGEIIPVHEPAGPLEAEAQNPEEPPVSLDGDEEAVTLAIEEVAVATVEEGPVTLAAVEDAPDVIAAEETSFTPLTAKASVEPVTPVAMENQAIPLVTEVIPIVLAEELPGFTEYLQTEQAEKAVLPVGMEDPAHKPKSEDIAVVLERSLKADKKPKDLGVSSITESINPVHDNGVSTQTVPAQAPPA